MTTPSRLEATLTIGFIGVTLGWMFMGVNAWNPEVADLSAALGLGGGVGAGATVAWLMHRRGREEDRH